MATYKSYLITVVTLFLWLEVSADNFWLNHRIDKSAQTVHVIVRDSSGLAWIGANKGLYLFDGCRCLKPKSGHGLDNVQIYDIKISPEQILLATDNGLYSQKTAYDSLRHFDNGLPSEIRALEVAGTSVWLCSVYGVWLFDKALEKGYEVTDINGGSIAAYSILRDRHGIIYIGAFSGLYRFDEQAKKLIPEKIPNDMGSIEALAEDGDGIIWVGTSRGLFKMSSQRNAITPIPGTKDLSVRALKFDHRNGVIYVGTNTGLFSVENDDVKIRGFHLQDNLFSLGDNSIWSLYVDGEGNVWAGTEKGFSIFPDKRSSASLDSRNIQFEETDECEITRFLFDPDKSIVWTGSTNGLTEYDIARGVSRQIYLPNSRVRDLHHLKDGKIAVATDNGLSIYDAGIDSSQHIIVRNPSGSRSQTWVYGIQESGDTLWLGSYLGGIMGVAAPKLERAEGDVISDVEISSPEKMENNMVNQLEKDRNGNLWASLSHVDSLICISDNGRKVAGVPLSTRGRRIEPWGFVTAGNNVWVADILGIHVVDINSHDVRHIDIPYAYPGDRILAIGAVGDEIWVSRSSGIWSVDTAALDVRLLDLPFGDVTAVDYDVKSSMAILGIGNNMVRVDPSRLKKGKTGRPLLGIIIEGDGGNQKGKVGGMFESGKIVVNSGETLTVGVMAKGFSPLFNPRFIWKEGNDSVWHLLPRQQPFIELSNLGVGNHRIFIKEAGLEDTPEGLSFVVRCLPPWYLSWWAIVVYAFALGVGLWMLVAYINRKNKRRREDSERESALASVNEKLLFLSNISHDLKTPLSLIMGPICELRDSMSPSDPALEKLNLAYENAHRLNSLVQRAVNLNSVEGGKDGFMVYSRINIVEFSKSVFEQYERNHPRRHFVFTSSDDCIVADVDAVKFESILNNLISNSCKYSGDESTISCNVEREGEMVEIALSDDGFGIPKEEQSLIFERMFRSKKTSTLREGTGLGLYLIKRYTEQHGGKITVESVEDQGTTFRVKLPLAKEATVDDKKDVDKPQKCNGKKILIVEDNVQIAGYIQRLLSDKYATAVAYNGRAGLGVASSFNPDVIIADEMMPTMTGLEMCRQLRGNARLASIPVILLTAKEGSATENEGVAAGVRVIMHKPFDPSVLLAQIDRLISFTEKLKESLRIQYLTEPHPIEGLSTTEKQLSMLAKIIEDNISSRDLNVALLSRESGINSKQVYRLVTKYIGVPPSDYIRQMRLRKAALLLTDGKFNVSEVMYMVGFSSSSYFSKCFADAYGCSPGKYIERQKDKNGPEGLDVF